jgi:hypothetical protein
MDFGFDDTSEEKKWSEDEINILQTLARILPPL